MNPTAVVLCSGGLDSCVTATIARNAYRLALLHVQYGQRTQQREVRAFHQIADHLQAEHRLVTSIAHLRQIGGSSLTDTRIDVTAANLDATDVPSSYVPFRNAHLLAIAVSWAEVLGARTIFLGAVEEDSSGYPDCRRSFIDAFQTAANMGTKPETEIRIKTPLINLSKRDIVVKAQDIQAPIELSWSCYTSSDLACGVCDSCALRLRGFQHAGHRDPIPYLDDAHRGHYG